MNKFTFAVKILVLTIVTIVAGNRLDQKKLNSNANTIVVAESGGTEHNSGGVSRG